MSQKRSGTPTARKALRRRYSPEFRQQAVEQMKVCTNVSALARRLGIRRKWLYKWKREAAQRGREPAKAPPPDPRDGEIQRLRTRIAELEQTVGQQTMEIRFFKNALHRFEEIRQRK